MINYQTITQAVRKRVITASGINPLTEFQRENEVFDPAEKTLWISEFVSGGDEVMLSPRRSRISSFIIQYEIFTPIGTGTRKADTVVNAIFSEFNLADTEHSSVAVEGYSANVTSIKVNKSDNGEISSTAVVLTLDIVSS